MNLMSNPTHTPGATTLQDLDALRTLDTFVDLFRSGAPGAPGPKIGDVLAALGDPDRRVWVADSFEGLPVPDERYPADAHLDWSDVEVLKVDADAVRANFDRYGLLEDRVRFLEGWFADTLPGAPIERLAVLRLDGDLYGSTMDALTALEPKVAPGGFVLVDDYGGWPSCREAVEDYRAAQGIDAPIHEVDWTGVWWRKP